MVNVLKGILFILLMVFFFNIAALEPSKIFPPARQGIEVAGTQAHPIP